MSSSRLGRGLLNASVWVANYFFMVGRHEGAHSLAAMLTGARVVDVHLWPPEHGNLAWTTVVATRIRQPWEIAVQAALPHLLSIATIITALALLSRVRASFQRYLLLACVWFPLADLTLHVVTYREARNDLFFVFGPSSTGTLVVLGGWIAGLAVLSVARVRDAGRKRDARS